MADESNTIRLNPSKSSTLEFDVMVSGLENIQPIVRFVIQNIQHNVDWVVTCSKLEGTKWQASFPVFEGLKVNTCKFSVEVIVDEYFFKPAEGEIIFVNSPDVSFKPSNTPKPSVTTSFTVKQDETQPKSKRTKKKVNEASGGPDVTGQYAPTNDLLLPEENPEDTQGKVKTAQAELDDQFIDQSKLDDIADEVIPGEGEQYPQDDNKDDDEFDPKKVAENIVKSTVGNIHKPTTRGSLFKRDADGKVIIPGLETAKQKQELERREQRVKELLR